MGYNYNLGLISNKRLELIKKIKDNKELFNLLNPNEEYDEDLLGVYDISEMNLHCFGSNPNWFDGIPKEYIQNVFEDNEFNEEITSDNDLLIINKECLKYIIEELRKEMENYYLEKWALSIFLEILILKDINEIKKWEKAFTNACAIIFDKEYSYNKSSLIEMNMDLYELFKEENTEIRNKSLDYISSQMLSYFRNELNEYQQSKVPFYNIDEKKKHSISNSSKYDKVILELTHILKTFNFKKNKLLIYGY